MVEKRPSRLAPVGLTAGIILYAVAMAYLEAAVVVYLRAAMGVPTGRIFPIDLSPAAMPYGWIEVGREAATLVMIGAVAWIAGRSPLERLAWGAVIFGVWDIGYYAWLWVFSGWPPSVHTWDLLFLIPAPWAGPVWAPIAVSAALIGFGLMMRFCAPPMMVSPPRMSTGIGPVMASTEGTVCVAASWICTPASAWAWSRAR